MAQSARLNLRMQKELKLLLTDPPHGASFPFLSADSDLTSLSTIHAQIEGPEGTVYAKGVFDITIQIPERYPFQPPSVTLATPIYHPNIDTGGRICLDILNLPPKGAWQPSLNISTVLTSIGLLLSEPNPDDGLMCEASSEYKYNRQAFDQKARSMTEKYAKGRAGASNCSTQGVQTNSNPSTKDCRGSEESRVEVSESVSSHKKSCGISRKLSLESSNSSQKRDSDGEVKETHDDHLRPSIFENHMEAKGKRKEVNITLDECNLRRDKLHGTRRKLSLGSSCQIQKKDRHDKDNGVPNQSSLLNPQTTSKASSGSSTLQHSNYSLQEEYHHHHHHHKNEPMDSINTSSKQACQFNQQQPLESLDTSQKTDGNNTRLLITSQALSSQSRSNPSVVPSSLPLYANSREQLHKDSIDRMGNVSSTDAKCKKICSVSKKLSLGLKGSSQGLEKDNKENVTPPLSTPQISSTKNGIARKLSLGCNENESNQVHDGRIGGKIEQRKIENSPMPEELVVLDSEDSEDERDGAFRSKLSLARKRIGKWRAKA